MKREIIRFLSSFGYIGYAPKMPGTFGTLGGIPIVMALAAVNNNYFYYVFMVVFFMISVYTAGKAEDIYGEKDSGKIVIDEVMGYIITMFMVEATVLNMAMAFVLFRLFDIIKPGPIKKLQEIKGGFGVVIDDVAAGIAAGIILKAITVFAGI